MSKSQVEHTRIGYLEIRFTTGTTWRIRKNLEGSTWSLETKIGSASLPMETDELNKLTEFLIPDVLGFELEFLRGLVASECWRR